MYARRQMLPDNAPAHVFFRCHNRQYFLRPNFMKDYLIELWAKHKHRYGIKIYDFIIMDNHAHLLIKARTTANLGNFMRTVNSQLARKINRVFKRDSQALRERYKSPLISTISYLHKTMQYIWLNRYQVDPSSNPATDRYCSAAWHLNPEIYRKIKCKKESLPFLKALIDCDEDFHPKDRKKFVRDLLNQALGNLESLTAKIFTHSHTIGDEEAVSFRSQIFTSLRRIKQIIPAHIGA